MCFKIEAPTGWQMAKSLVHRDLRKPSSLARPKERKVRQYNTLQNIILL